MNQNQIKPYDELVKVYESGEKIISNNQFSQRELISWLLRTNGALNKIFSIETPIKKTTRELLKTARTDFGKDKFLKAFRLFKNFYMGISSFSDKSLLPTVHGTSNKSVFLIHGHDEVNILRLVNMMRDDFKYHPILMRNKPGLNRYLLDKFEQEAELCDFAIALFTKDDEITNKSSPYYQARPNVVFEFGWFIGRFSKNNLLIVLENGVRLHSDYDGVSRVQFKDNVENAYKDIEKELTGLGFL